MSKGRVNYQLYLVTDEKSLGHKHFLETIEEALCGGVTIVQLREKHLDSREFYERAKELHQLTKAYDVPLIINDRIDIALAIGAEGVHLGQKDLPVSVARKLAGEKMILGVSAATPAEALTAEKEGADYLGVGAMYPTGTKEDTRPVTLETLSTITEKVKIPVVAIGGITKENSAEVIDRGVHGVALVSAILKAVSPKNAAEDFNRVFDERGARTS